MLLRNKKNKIIIFTTLFISIAALNIGCAPQQRSNSVTAKEGLEAMLYTVGTLNDLGVMPRALPVPVTSGELPYGFLVDVEDANLAVLMGFSGFTQQEVNESASKIIPFATSLLEESFGGTVTEFSPQALAGIGLTDAQSVHKVIENNLYDEYS